MKSVQNGRYTATIVTGLILSLLWCIKVEAGQGITKDALTRALSIGNSLGVIRVTATGVVDAEPWWGSRVIQAQVSRLLISGDLNMPHLPARISFPVPQAYGGVLKTGKYYAIFLNRDSPRGVSWTFSDNIIELESLDDLKLTIVTLEPV